MACRKASSFSRALPRTCQADNMIKPMKTTIKRRREVEIGREMLSCVFDGLDFFIGERMYQAPGRLERINAPRKSEIKKKRRKSEGVIRTLPRCLGSAGCLCYAAAER